LEKGNNFNVLEESMMQTATMMAFVVATISDDSGSHQNLTEIFLI
jgi:hypothetical protein